MKKEKQNKKLKLNRRDFTKGLSASLGAGLAGSAYGTNVGSQSDVDLAEEYDFIVVGSGAGGGPLASNLAKAGFSVLVLEAGSRDNHKPVRNIPLFHGTASEDSDLSWAFYTNHYQDPERQSAERKHYQDGEASWSARGGIYYPRGSTIGGSTAVNAMITMLPHLEDFDYIADITGDHSWRSLDLNPFSPNKPGMIFKYLKKVEAWLPIKLSDLEVLANAPDLTKILLSAVKSQGLGSVIKNIGNLFDPDKILDPNSFLSVVAKKEGVFQVPMSIGNHQDLDRGVNVAPGTRGGVRKLLLDTESQYSNLKIQTDAFVSQLVFDNESKTPKVVGVEVMIGEKLYRAEREYQPGVDAATYPKKIIRAKYEVIVSAGAFNTPQLLKLSGIGPREEIESLGIAVKVDLPGVGTNLQDRYEIPVISKMRRNLPVRAECTFGEDGDPCLADYLNKNGEGTLYGSNGSSLAIIKKSDEAKRKGQSPDLFVFGLAGRFDGYTERYSDLIRSISDQFTWLVLKGHTNNTAGTVTLRSADPLERPEINFNYYEEGNDPIDDLQGVLEGVKVARDTMKAAEGIIEDEVMPGEQVQSDESLKEYIKTESWGHHASCTCPIGADDDPMAVLDSKFRVRGVDGLRVVDASIFPKIPGFFIALPIFIISEKASDEIIDQYS